MSEGAVSPLSFERYELKYLIPLSLVSDISRFAEIYCDLDYFARISSDNFYTINSLYLDTPQLYLFRNRDTNGPARFNMRIRSYGDDPKPPYYFEIKQKIHQFVRKKRARVFLSNWQQILETGEIPDEVDASSRDYLETFLQTKMTYNMEPVILTQYRRKAYISRADDYARVTFDRDLRYQESREWSVIPEERTLSHYDHLESFDAPGENVVLELKCEKKVPLWMIDMIRIFDLNRSSFSKFGNSMENLLMRPDIMLPGPRFF